MKHKVSKPPKVALCRRCHGTGKMTEIDERTLRRREAVCGQCGGSGRVLVSAEIEFEIVAYNPK